MFYCLYNGHADITGMVDENGKLSEKYYYDEWGLETETLKYGDVTGDGNVNINDYSLLKKYILEESSELTSVQSIVSDLNSDGTVDVHDSNILKQIVLKSVRYCPADENRDGFINEKSNIKYAGYFYDGETGLYYLNARFYDPETARFIQEDSYNGEINDPLSLNLYTYSHNNPISYYDPTGHSIKDVFNTMAEKIESAKKTVKKAAKKVVNKVKEASEEYQENWLIGYEQLKESGMFGKMFASYSEGVVVSLNNTKTGAIKFVDDPFGTLNETVNYFLADPLKNNPIAGVLGYYTNIAKASYAHDWDV